VTPEIPYRIRRSPRARRVSVRVDAGSGVEVVLPRRARAGAAAEAVEELRPWIERRLLALELARGELDRPAGTVPYLGETLALELQDARARVHRDGSRLLVPAEPAAREAALERWYRRQARAEVAKRLDRACAEVGATWGPLTIRGQRTRWASCSASGAMSFNWRLLLAPSEVLDSVVWHEVCHLEVRDHSAAFWALLASRCPDHRRQEAWLRRYGPLLAL
jgi:predicted metal-dependent hydrolase